MKKFVSEVLEQVRGEEKPQKVTEGLKEQIDPVKTVSDAWKQILGKEGNTLNEKAQAEKENKEIGDITKFLEGEKKAQGTLKGNVEILSAPPVKNKEPPPPEKPVDKLPELAPTPYKAARGNLFGLGKTKKSGPPLKSIEYQRKTQQ